MGSLGTEQVQLEYPFLEKRFAALKQELIKPEHKQKLIESYGRLIQTLRAEAKFIEKIGPSLIPEIDFEDVRENDGLLPEGFAEVVRERGCVILRNVVSEEQAVNWEKELKDYTSRHPGVGGYPKQKPAIWNIFWTKPQTEMRTHSNVLAAMRSVSRLWHLSDPATPIDLDSQIIYPDRIRIRYPSDDPGQFPLAPHLDSGAIERWEDEENRKNYQAIFDGDWQNWDGWLADHRVNAKSDLYQSPTSSSCSAWRSLQGWLSLSHTNTGEGSLRLFPSLRLSMAYIMLRPFFITGEFDDTLPIFPGSTPGKTQFFPTPANHPDLELDRCLIGIPPVRPGDYVFWHCDLVHGVDSTNPGLNDSSVSYNGCNPLTPYNIDSLLGTREAFQAADVPYDFTRAQGDRDREYQHADHGARVENILSDQGLQAMGIKKLDEEEAGLCPGQKAVRQLANARLGLRG